MAEVKEQNDVPKLENGRVDWFALVDQVFPDQIGVASYVKGMLKGYALDQSIDTANRFKDFLESGVDELALLDVIPEHLRPQDKVTSKDIN